MFAGLFTWLRIILKIVAGFVFAVFFLICLFFVLFYLEDVRLRGEVRTIKAWIAAELPAGSTVPTTIRVLRSHKVTEECLYYNEPKRYLNACYSKANRWYEPIEAFIEMRFYFSQDGHLERSTVELSYTFL